MESQNFSNAAGRNWAETPMTAGLAPVATQRSAVAWSAVIAGAAAAAALSLILLVLGTGLGMSTVSPWTDRGMSAAGLGVATILWVTFTQLAASGVGGYLAGRLRTQWTDAERDEVYFRDTAHGFLAWGVATLATAALLTSTIGSVVSGGVEAGASVVGGAARTATAGAVAGGAAMATSDRGENPLSYFVDSLFRKSNTPALATDNIPPPEANAALPAGSSSATDTGNAAGAMPGASAATAANAAAGTRGETASPEVARIFMNSLRSGPLPADDLRYVTQLVAERAGVSQQEAEKRVGETYARAQAKLRETEAAIKDAADQARKASAYAALWLFISLLIGAFVASLAATYGGRQRDLPAYPSFAASPSRSRA